MTGSSVRTASDGTCSRKARGARPSRGGDGRAALGPVLGNTRRERGDGRARRADADARARGRHDGRARHARRATPRGRPHADRAASHIRVGTFQFFAARRRPRGAANARPPTALRGTITPDPRGRGTTRSRSSSGSSTRRRDLVAQVCSTSAFVHGVMNTDNTSVSGETIDYGPCAFLDDYDPERTFSSIDHGGRYAFSHQPRIARWNLARASPSDAARAHRRGRADEAVRIATERLEGFAARFEEAHLRVMRAKLGLAREDEDDRALIEGLFCRARGTARRRLARSSSAGQAAAAADPSARRPASRRCSKRSPARSVRGWRHGAAGLATETGDAGGAGVRDAPHEPRLHPPQPPRRRGYTIAAVRRGGLPAFETAGRRARETARRLPG